NLLSIVS
ncbi:transposase IS66 family protein, partial [Trichonephila inaurata madagascariensis]